MVDEPRVQRLPRGIAVGQLANLADLTAFLREVAGFLERTRATEDRPGGGHH